MSLLLVHDLDVHGEGGGDWLVVADPELVSGCVGGETDPLPPLSTLISTPVHLLVLLKVQQYTY